MKNPPRRDLEKKELKTLKPYAVFSSKSRGRQYKEDEDFTRTIFQRDRDRIIHSKAFRRLSGKTQVFIATHGDHFRDRLSHTLEVAQIARDIARSLSLNEDLAETIALAHDLGHTPFGHAGEYVLDEIMQKFGRHFEHNEQSKRIVEKLEKRFPDWEGLNLSFEVRQGLEKHQTLYDQKSKKIVGKMLEMQVVDIADEIAYHNHDIDDGLRSKLFTIKDLLSLDLCREAVNGVYKKYGKNLNKAILKHRTISFLISMMIRNVLEATIRNIKNFNIKNFADVLKQRREAVKFSPQFRKKVDALKEFLWKKMYKSKTVLSHSNKGQKILAFVFWKYFRNPKLLPKRYLKKINIPPDFDPLEVIVMDYVAGMTDVFAKNIWEKYGSIK